LPTGSSTFESGISLEFIFNSGEIKVMLPSEG
jgi:hypothetical protein